MGWRWAAPSQQERTCHPVPLSSTEGPPRCLAGRGECLGQPKSTSGQGTWSSLLAISACRVPFGLLERWWAPCCSALQSDRDYAQRTVAQGYQADSVQWVCRTSAPTQTLSLQRMLKLIKVWELPFPLVSTQSKQQYRQHLLGLHSNFPKSDEIHPRWQWNCRFMQVLKL